MDADHDEERNLKRQMAYAVALYWEYVRRRRGESSDTTADTLADMDTRAHVNTHHQAHSAAHGGVFGCRVTLWCRLVKEHHRNTTEFRGDGIK